MYASSLSHLNCLTEEAGFCLALLAELQIKTAAQGKTVLSAVKHWL